MSWTPGPDPYPRGPITDLSGFDYLDELHFVRHAKVHVNKTPRSLWQLAADFRVRMTVYAEGQSPYQVTITAPRGLITDLASVPQIFHAIVGPIGPHLEASIIHDYLYMAWTDYRTGARRDDWRFADRVFYAGMTKSDVRKRDIIYAAVHSDFTGWPVFRKKSYTLRARMDEWLPLLDAGHGRS